MSATFLVSLLLSPLIFSFVRDNGRSVQELVRDASNGEPRRELRSSSVAFSYTRAHSLIFKSIPLNEKYLSAYTSYAYRSTKQLQKKVCIETRPRIRFADAINCFASRLIMQREIGESTMLNISVFANRSFVKGSSSSSSFRVMYWSNRRSNETEQLLKYFRIAEEWNVLIKKEYFNKKKNCVEKERGKRERSDKIYRNIGFFLGSFLF